MSPEQIVAYLRGGDTDAREVEAHVRACPSCGMEMLLARETLREIRPGVREVRPSTRRKPLFVRRRRSEWIPWLAAAAVLVMAIIVAVTARRPEAPTEGPAPKVVTQPPLVEQPPKAPQPPVPAPPEPKTVKTPPEQPPDPPKPAPRHDLKPAPRPKPPALVTPRPAPKPAPKPATPRPKTKPKPTVVQRPVVATVVRAVGTGDDVVGKTIHAGETFATAGEEFAALDLLGHGSVYFNQKSRAEFTGAGQIVLHEGEIIGQMERGSEPAQVRTPEHEFDMETALFDLRVSAGGTDLTIVDGRARVGRTRMEGPSMMSLRKGRTPYVRTVGAGFAGWVPEQLGTREFVGWFEAEAAQTLKGFTALPWDFASGAQAAVQTSSRGAAMAYKAPLPYRGKYVAWVRVRQYEDKAVNLGLVVNNRRTPNVQLSGAEGMPWRWVGPVPLTSDRLELILSALSVSAFQQGANRRSFPVVADLVLVSSDLKYIPPARLPEERRNYAFGLTEP